MSKSLCPVGGCALQIFMPYRKRPFNPLTPTPAKTGRAVRMFAWRMLYPLPPLLGTFLPSKAVNCLGDI